MLGRLFHYGVDAVVLSALLAGVKRTTGLTPSLDGLPEPTGRNIAEKYLGVGEFMFDSTVAAAHASKYFVRTTATSSAPVPPGLDRLEKPKPAGSGWFS